MNDISSLLSQPRQGAKVLNRLSDDQIRQIILRLAEETVLSEKELLRANQIDLDQMDRQNPKYDRLKLTPQRLEDIVADMRNVASLPSVLGLCLAETVRPNGMKIRKVSVPFGVIGIIFEARPNVCFDVFVLCLKSGNASVLKGSRDAYNSNRAIVGLIHKVLHSFAIPSSVCTLLPPDQEATTALLHATGKVDIIIPRGSSNLIRFVRDHAKIPVIETGAGICHTYFDKEGDVAQGEAIVRNAKTRRVSVCNALDCLIVHKDRLEDLPKICRDLPQSNVIIYADEPAYNVLNDHYPGSLLERATADSFGTEFLDYKMSVKTVNNIEEALEHISTFSSQHSETIVSQNKENIALFEREVDAACVYANVSTAFTDGAQFGFGAEIGISTQKLHARGPMALAELTTYKYIIEGDGLIRS